MTISDIDPRIIRQLLDYDFESGSLTWLPREPHWFSCIKDPRGPEWFCNVWNGKHANKEAMSHVTKSGYKYGRVLTKYSFAHRVVWAHVNGVWPEGFIDHVNRNKLDNRIENLRIATRSQNTANSNISTTSSSKFKGVSWCKRTKKWSSGITVSGKRKFLGYFEQEKDAALSYDAAAFRAHGEYALLNFGERHD